MSDEPEILTNAAAAARLLALLHQSANEPPPGVEECPLPAPPEERS